jgi:hypothetical protein
VIPLLVFFVNDKNRTKKVNTGVTKTRPRQQNKTNIFPRNNSERSNATSFPLVSQVLLLLMHVVLPHLSQHAKAATAEGLTFSDPMHKKSARNSNLYYFCHSRKKLTAVSPFSNALHNPKVPVIRRINTSRRRDMEENGLCEQCSSRSIFPSKDVWNMQSYTQRKVNQGRHTILLEALHQKLAQNVNK